jgi:biopolymer transport protein TolR
MGIQMQSRDSGRGSRRGKYRPLAEINVTPFVDVMLVLLIVFMVTAPLLTSGIKVDLPKVAAKALPEDDKPIEVTIDHSGAIFLQETRMEKGELVPRLLAIAGNRKDMRIYVRGDMNLAYGSVMAIIGDINQAGFTKVALIADPRK